jgi:hypothetical protein
VFGGWGGWDQRAGVRQLTHCGLLRVSSLMCQLGRGRQIGDVGVVSVSACNDLCCLITVSAVGRGGLGVLG